MAVTTPVRIREGTFFGLLNLAAKDPAKGWKYSIPGLNWGPPACEAGVITTRPMLHSVCQRPFQAIQFSWASVWAVKLLLCADGKRAANIA